MLGAWQSNDSIPIKKHSKGDVAWRANDDFAAVLPMQQANDDFAAVLPMQHYSVAPTEEADVLLGQGLETDVFLPGGLETDDSLSATTPVDAKNGGDLDLEEIE